MHNFYQSDASFAEIMEGKALRRDELTKAIQEADPAVLAPAAERLRDAMRKKDSEPRRQRLGPPAFSKQDL
ncbi:hypothetical protein ACUYGA_22335 [Metapseudomonas otitidis]|uniref:hypothetical protein n=1 Tax=Metapseudomonas otitidis TaxID=319939 RepID=UPI0040557216